MGNPVLEINTKLISQNAASVRGACANVGIDPTAVIKGYNAIDEITDVLADAGYTSFASSRTPHLKRVKERYDATTMALRIPMPSEVESVVEYADISLNSEMETIKLLDREAGRRRKIHKVILMRDLGDLREGYIDARRFIEAANLVEMECRNIHLYGVGANLSCYGTVIPTVKNLSRLASDAKEIERCIGRPLEVISGGSSTSLYMVINGDMPGDINHLRIGGANMMRSEARDISEDALPELTDEAFVLKAEIIEIGEKPTHPIGVLDRDCFLNTKEFEDKGVRRRALLAVGAFDIGDHKQLVPLDGAVTLLGCSSDHLIADIQDSDHDYHLGETIPMILRYQAMLFATANSLIEKKIVL